MIFEPFFPQEWKEYKLQRDTELRFEVEHNATVNVKVGHVINIKQLVFGNKMGFSGRIFTLGTIH